VLLALVKALEDELEVVHEVDGARTGGLGGRAKGGVNFVGEGLVILRRARSGGLELGEGGIDLRDGLCVLRGLARVGEGIEAVQPELREAVHGVLFPGKTSGLKCRARTGEIAGAVEEVAVLDRGAGDCSESVQTRGKVSWYLRERVEGRRGENGTMGSRGEGCQ